MTLFTYCQVKKSFFIALAVMVTGLFILKFSNGNNPPASSMKNGQSVVVLKKVYSAFIKNNFTKVKTYQWTPKTKALTIIQVNTFNHTEKETPSLKKYTLNIPDVKIK